MARAEHDGNRSKISSSMQMVVKIMRQSPKIYEISSRLIG